MLLPLLLLLSLFIFCGPPARVEGSETGKGRRQIHRKASGQNRSALKYIIELRLVTSNVCFCSGSEFEDNVELVAQLEVEQGQHGLARTAPGLRLQQAFGRANSERSLSQMAMDCVRLRAGARVSTCWLDV